MSQLNIYLQNCGKILQWQVSENKTSVFIFSSETQMDVRTSSVVLE